MLRDFVTQLVKEKVVKNSIEVSSVIGDRLGRDRNWKLKYTRIPDEDSLSSNLSDVMIFFKTKQDLDNFVKDHLVK
jgi:hypothetical protein